MVENNQLLIPVFGEYITKARKNCSVIVLAQLYSRRGVHFIITMDNMINVCYVLKRPYNY